VEIKQPLRVLPKGVKNIPDRCQENGYSQLDPDLDDIWRLAIGLDLGNRSVLEAEVLMWRICKAKSLPRDAMRRALNEEWEGD
jgi:hypothetical protein